LSPDLIFLKLKCTKFDFGWGSAPDPAGGAHIAPPNLLAEFWRVLLLREGGEEKRRAQEGREKVKGGGQKGKGQNKKGR